MLYIFKQIFMNASCMCSYFTIKGLKVIMMLNTGKYKQKHFSS